MRNTDGFWALIDEHLDARRDPLDDARVQEHLSSHPELLDAFADLTDAVRMLSRPLPMGRASNRSGVAAAAALLLVAIVGWWVLETNREPRIELPDLASEGQVMRYSSRCFTSGLGGQLSREIEAGSVSVLERSVLTQIQPRATTPHGHSIRTEITRRSSRVRPEFITE